MSDPQPTIPNASIQAQNNRFQKRATPYIPPLDSTMPMATAQDTVPMGSVKPIPAPPKIAPVAIKSRSLPTYRREPAPKSKKWLWGIVALGISVVGVVVFSVILVMGGIYGRGVLPNVSVGNISVGGLSVEEVTAELNARWTSITLQSGSQTWQVAPNEIGISFNAQQTAENAFAIGRDNGNALQAILGRVSIEPSVSFDIAMAENYFLTNQDAFFVAPINAGVALVNGTVQSTPPQNGAQLDIQGTLAQWNTALASEMSDGVLDLVATPIQPDVLDASMALENARALLTNPLEIRVYDPVTDNSAFWSIPPEQWGTWLTAIPDINSPIGLALIVQDAPLRDYLTQQSAVFDASRYIDIEASIVSIQDALARGNPREGFAIVKHNSTTHVVQSGESLTSIAWDYGIPYLYIQEVNGGRDTFGVGESIVIPPADLFLLYPVVPNKRIVVSIPEQQVRVYENGQLIQDWNASTGISDSPTWRGLYQVISHEPNAYAGNWNLYMPYFIGVYQPIPNAEFTNGFHGFPTRGGGQLLWENSIGTKVTYGCILLSTANIQWLYEWAEEGVVVVIE